MIFNSLLQKALKKGHLVWIRPNGEEFEFGDKTGNPIRMRTTSGFSEIKMMMNPSLHFGESYMDGSMILEEGNIHDLLKLIFVNSESDVDHWAIKMTKIIRAIRNKIIPSNYIAK